MNRYSSLGYRIIGLASKAMKGDGVELESVPREELEGQLEFRGFLILANKLKPETRGVIEELQVVTVLFYTIPLSECINKISFRR